MENEMIERNRRMASTFKRANRPKRFLPLPCSRTTEVYQTERLLSEAAAAVAISWFGENLTGRLG